MRLFVVAAFLSLVAGVASAASDAAAPWTGVWQGTVGQAQVRACFGPAGDGSYYYLRHLTLIPLEHADAKTPAWTERGAMKPAPRWTLAASDANTLTGRWSTLGPSLPIHLARVKLANAEEAEAPCGGITFHGPRVVTPTVTRKAAVLDGVRYTRLVANVGKQFGADIEAFALDATTPAAKRINAALAKPLPVPGGATRPDYLDCAMNAAADFGEQADFTDDQRPVLILRRWLVSEETNSGACGGAHPYAGVSYRLWSLETGAATDPWTWFTPSAAVPPTPDSLPQIGPRLRKLLAAHWRPQDKECADVIDSVDDWDIHPTRRGLAFWPQLPHVAFACSDDVVIPYRDLTPLLNAKGHAAIASIAEDLEALPPPAKHRS